MKWLRLLALLLLDLLLAAPLVVLVAFFTLQSPPGRDWLAGTVGRLATEEVNGSVTIGGLEGDLINRLRLIDTQVLDGTGQPVASVPAIEIRYALAALLDGNLEITLVRFEGLELLADAALADALMPVPKATPEPPSSPPDISIALRRVEVREGRALFPGQPLEENATWQLDAAGIVGLSDLDFRASTFIQLRNLHLPTAFQPQSLPQIEGPSSVDLSAAIAADALTLSASMQLGDYGAAVTVNGTVAGEQSLLSATVATSRISLAPPSLPVSLSARLVAGLHFAGIEQGLFLVQAPELSVNELDLRGTTVRVVRNGDALSGEVELALAGTAEALLHINYSLVSRHLLATLLGGDLRSSQFGVLLPLPTGTSAVIKRVSVAASAHLAEAGPPWSFSASIDAADLAAAGTQLEALTVHVIASGEGVDGTGSALLSAPTLDLPGTKLDDLAAILVRSAQGPLRLGLSATHVDGSVSATFGTSWDGTWRIPDVVQILGLAGSYRGLAVVSKNTPEVSLGEVSHLTLSSWELGIAGGKLQLEGSCALAANRLNAKVRWQDLQLAPLGQAFDLPIVTAIATGELDLSGESLASPTLSGSLQLRGLEQQTTDLVRELTATLSYSAGMARVGLDASPLPAGHVNLTGTLPVDLSLRPYSFQFHDAPDADLVVEALPLDTVARFLPPDLPLAGILSATGHLGGTFDAPEWDFAGTLRDLDLPVVRPLNASFSGRLDAAVAQLTVQTRWAPTSSIELKLTAPPLRLLPVPEDLAEWLRRVPPGHQLLSISSPSMVAGDILREPPPMGGVFSGMMVARGGLDSLALAAELHASRPVFGDLALAESIDLKATHQNSVLEASGQLALRAGGRVRLGAQVPLALSLLPFSLAIEEDRATAEIWFSQAQLSAIAAVLPETLGVTGVLDGYTSFAMPLSAPTISAALRARDVSLPNSGLLDVFLTATVEDDLLIAAAGVARKGRDLVRLQAQAPAWRLGGVGDTPVQWLARWKDGSHSLRAQLNSIRLAEFLPKLPPEALLSAAASVLETPGHVAVNAEVSGLSWADHQVKLVLAGDSDTQQARVQTDLLLDGESVASATGTVGELGSGSWFDSPLDAPIDFSADLSRAVDIFLRMFGAQYELKFDAPPTLVATAQGSISALSAKVQMRAGGASIRGLAIQQFAADASLDEQGAQVALSLASHDAGSVQANADLTSTCLSRVLDGDCDVGASGLSGHVIVADVSDKPLRPFLPRGYEVNYAASGDVTIGGTLDAPTVDGTVAADVARLRIPLLGWDLKDIAVRLHSDGHVAVLAPVVLMLKDGSATLDARVDLASQAVAARLRLIKMPVSNRTGLRVIANGEAGVRGTLEKPEVYGDVDIVEARIRDFPLSSDELHPLQLDSDVVYAADLVERGSLAEFLFGKSGDWQAEEPSFGQRIHGQVNVHIPGRFFYTGQGADLELEGDLAIGLAGLTPRVTGAVRTRRGEVNIFGRLFTLRKVAVEFTGSEPVDPVLDVEAVHPLRGVDLSAYGLESFPDSHILVTIGGRVSNPEMSVSSNPLMSEDQIMTVLVMGRSRGGTDEAGADAAGLLAGLIAQPLQAQLVRKLPVDTLNLQTGEKGLEDARVSAGRYLASWLFLRYVYQFGAMPDENRNEGHLEVRFTNRLLLETVYGDAGAGSADFFFRMNY